MFSKEEVEIPRAVAGPAVDRSRDEIEERVCKL